MSLLDDVSIVVTPNGYKAGELYAVIPVPTEGAEEVTNGNFATETVWTFTNVGFSVGAVLFDNATDNIFQNFSDTINTIYKLTITKTGSGTLRLRTGYAGSAATKIDIPESGILYFTSTGDTNRIQIYGDSGSVSATLNSVSVKEWTGADMDVTRATAATRVDENGLVNYAEVLGSDLVTCGDFECAVPLNSWTTGTGWSISGGKAIFSGSNFSNLEPSTYIVVVGNTYKLNLIAEVTNGSFKVQNTGNPDLITESSSGTYSVVFTATSTLLTIARASVGIQNDFTIDNISVKEVTRDNVPRIDYTGGGCPHILAEPQRTNVVTYSEDFTQSFWVKSNAVITPNDTISPNGTLTGSLLKGNGVSFPRIQSVVSSSGQVALSFFVKKELSDEVTFYISGTGIGGADSTSVYKYTFSTDSFSKISGGTVDSSESTSFGNGWVRLDIIYTTTTITGLRIYPQYNSTSTDGVYIWGVQLEVGSYATSYIPTSGSAVTRNQDIFTRDGIGSLINSTEGVLFAEFKRVEGNSTTSAISLNDGTSSNGVSMYFFGVSNFYVDVFSSSGTITLNGGIVNTSDYIKVAFKYKNGDSAIWINGIEVTTNSGAISLVGLNQLLFAYINGTTSFYGKVKQLQVYDTSLTDNQLIQLTGEAGTHFFESYAEMAEALTYTIQ